MAQAERSSITRHAARPTLNQGDRFGLLTAIETAPHSRAGRTQWLFRCDCGQDHVAALDNVRAGRTQSCGCAKRISPLIAGNRYGQLIAIHAIRRNYYGRNAWLFECDCGQETIAIGYEVACGHVKSCGCLRSRAPTKHGRAASPEYNCWKNMVQRCTNPKHPSFDHYGGRGITVCVRWRDDFAAFSADVGPRPSADHSLDRHPDNDGPYAPGNVRWATRVEQARNVSTNRMVTLNGEEMPLVAACERSGVPYDVARGRLRNGWTTERALTTPVGT